MHDKWWFGAEGHWSAGVKMWHLKCHTGSFHFLTAVKARRFQTLKVENLWAVFFFFSSLEWFWPPDKMLYFKRIFSGCKHWTEELPSLASCSKTLQHVMCLQGRNQDCRSTEVMSPLPPPQYLSSRQVYFPVCRNVVSLSLLNHFFLSWCAEGKILVQQE